MSIRLNVDYTEKELAKPYGIRWNATDKYWYYPGDELPTELLRWYNPRQNPGYDERGRRITAGVQMTNAGEAAQIEGQMNIQEMLTTPAVVNAVAQAEIHQMNAVRTGGQTPQADGQQATHNAEMDTYDTVTTISSYVQRAYSTSPHLQTIRIKGEVTNFDGMTPGHLYFDLKDENSRLSCVMFAGSRNRGLRFQLQAGQLVGAQGYYNIYGPTGESKIVVSALTDFGEGDAARAYEELKARLNEEGLFDEDRKKTIPTHPKRVGIVTAERGKAIGDIQKVFREHNPYVQLILYCAKVQGVGAPESITQGIQVMDQQNVDVIIVGRGGGSDEDLSAFNQEMVARAAYEAQTPIISAVGHEGNWALLDLVADKRESTPTKAAEIICPFVLDIINRVSRLEELLLQNMKNAITSRQMLLNTKVATLQKYDPAVKLKRQQDVLANLQLQMKQNMQSLFDAKKHRYEVLVTSLHGFSPSAKLVDGFGYVSVNDQPVTAVKDVQVDDELKVRMHDGVITTKVVDVDVAEEE